MAAVTLKNIRKVYQNDVVALHDIDLTIDDGEFLVLVGPSGCGKSTLLRMIAGLEAISEGEIFIGDRLINAVPPKDRDVAMVFQNYALYPHMTVFENMSFALRHRKIPRQEIRERVASAAGILGLETLLHRRPKALSGGERQRVAVGRALVRNPQVFLFDEPLSNLDAKLRLQMRLEISRLQARLKTTMIYVTHDQVEALTLGTKIVVLKEGAIQQIDAPRRLYEQPANQFVAGFIGSPGMNFFSGQMSSENSRLFVAEDMMLPLPQWVGTLAAQIQAHKVVIGIRPEHVYDAQQPPDRTVTQPIPVTVDVIEPVGSDAYVYFTLGGSDCCMRLGYDPGYLKRDTIQVCFDEAKLYLFHPETGERLAAS